jgi:hypothetical protein
LQLGTGSFEGRRIVSAENIIATRTPKVTVSDKASYAMGWVVQQTPNGTIVWHNGGTTSFGSYFGLLPDRGVGVVVLTNEVNVGLPDALGRWMLDRILGNPKVDYVAEVFKAATAGFEKSVRQFAAPANPQPSPPVIPFAGRYRHPGVGEAIVSVDDGGLVMTLVASGAKLKLTSWNGSIFTAQVMPAEKFIALAENLGPIPNAFVQFQIDADAKPNVLHLSFDDGQAYDFTRE